MKIITIDDIEREFKAVIEKALPEKRDIELQYLDGKTADISTNAAIKCKDSLKVAENIRESLLSSPLMIKRIEISDKNHVNVFLEKSWTKVFLDLYENRGLDLLEKREKTVCLNPVSSSETRVNGYKKAMREIALLRSVKTEYGVTGERVALNEMKMEKPYAPEITDILSISRANNKEIEISSVSEANTLSNPFFKWNYIDYRLRNIAEILDEVSREKCLYEIDPTIWQLFLLKLNLKSAVDETIQFKDPSKFYNWKEKYLDSFYTLKPSKDNFTVRIANSLRLK